MKIISMIKINGQWVNQDDIPPDKAKEIIATVMCRAGDIIGAKVQTSKQKTA